MPTSFNQRIIDEFRAGGGKVGGPFEGGDLLLLTTTGARSGAEHTVPLGYVRDGAHLLVVASAGGAPRHPAWYHNLLARPLVRVEAGTEEFAARAVPAEGADRDRLFAQVVRTAPGYADYQSRTARILPVVVLHRAQAATEGAPAVPTLADKLLDVHTGLREQVRALCAEAEAYVAERAAHRGPGTPPAPGLGLQLRRHCVEFCSWLEFHHTSEDTHVFPSLARHHPHLRGVLDRLGEEHRTVAQIQRELLALLDGIGTAEPALFLAALRDLSRQLGAHLDHEEEALLPALAEIPFPPA
ncbi:nitroreductase/quinone reductase family protein [Streptomyces liangshanensis]|uniref:nitroreductase/quinone reductase family protein n=1 Tax=Streptomyces liangshanensis TaxID=2717324 RepID=UPI0036DCCBD8